ncbi:hypothetical protein ANO11243_062550 [Dothideomycetidae sp. 11243]|nr:hypothetical protein ANO11243_062550 [fungal sp. No.11243]
MVAQAAALTPSDPLIYTGDSTVRSVLVGVDYTAHAVSDVQDHVLHGCAARDKGQRPGFNLLFATSIETG